MANNVQPIPAGYHSVTPYLIVNDAAGAIDFYKQAFGASEAFRMEHGGKVGHAELVIGDSRIMLADEFPDMGARSPRSIGGTPVRLHLYIPDVDTVTQRALVAGAKEVRPIENQFYGDRSGTVEDPFGHVWHLSTHVEDVPPDELERRAKATMEQMAS
jgi:PhnB protein